MEEMILIESFKVCPVATQQQMADCIAELLKNDKKELRIFPDPENPQRYVGVLLAKYYTQELSGMAAVRETVQTGDFQQIYISRGGMRAYLGMLMRRMQAASIEEMSDSFAEILDVEPLDLFDPDQPIKEFLEHNPPVRIEKALNEQVIGQPELTKAVADFLYYHALRQLHPDLPQRPLMITGPSGNGKTEVWRAVMRLYSQVFKIKIIDGSNISCDGWAGNFKISTHVDATIAEGGILVVDEFDKLVKPKHNSKGDNVSLDVQAEFLKLIEGEYSLGKRNLTSKKMGFVMVGAFEALREEKKSRSTQPKQIGFSAEQAAPSAVESESFSDRDFIRYGIMPEIVGRIAAKCSVVELNEKAYMAIIRNPNSRVSQIERVLKSYGTNIEDVLSDEELRRLIAASKTNRTGVRWVSAQVEGRLLESIRRKGLGMLSA